MFFMNKIMIKLWTFHSYEGKASKIFLKIEWTWFSPFTLNSIDLLFRCGWCSYRLYSWRTNTGIFRRHRQSIAIRVCSLQSDLLYIYIVYCNTKKIDVRCGDVTLFWLLIWGLLQISSKNVFIYDYTYKLSVIKEFSLLKLPYNFTIQH